MYMEGVSSSSAFGGKKEVKFPNNMTNCLYLSASVLLLICLASDDAFHNANV